jgi:hypothetical protein
VVADDIGHTDEGAAALADDRVEIVEGLEVAVDEWLLEQSPEALGRLQLGTEGW